MSAPVPEYSPAMLSFFLRARAVMAQAEKPARCGMQATVKREKAAWRKLAKLTHTQIDLIWMGRLNRAEPRARLWAVLGHFPSDHGITLTDEGGQIFASRAIGAPAGRAIERDGQSALPPVSGGGSTFASRAASPSSTAGAPAGRAIERDGQSALPPVLGGGSTFASRAASPSSTAGAPAGRAVERDGQSALPPVSGGGDG